MEGPGRAGPRDPQPQGVAVDLEGVAVVGGLPGHDRDRGRLELRGILEAELGPLPLGRVQQQHPRVVHAAELHADLRREREVARRGQAVDRASGSCPGSAPAGSTKRSVRAAAVSVSTPFRTRHPAGGLPAGSSGNGKSGSFNAVTRVVCHDIRRARLARPWEVALPAAERGVQRRRAEVPHVVGDVDRDPGRNDLVDAVKQIARTGRSRRRRGRRPGAPWCAGR